MTKALDVLKEYKNVVEKQKLCFLYGRIDEAILELEELQETVRVLQNENVLLKVKLSDIGKRK